MQLPPQQPELFLDSHHGAAAAGRHLGERDSVVIAPHENLPPGRVESLETVFQEAEPIILLARGGSGPPLKLASQQIRCIATMIVGDPPQPRGLGLELVAGDREEPGRKVGASRVFLEPRVGRYETCLGNVIDIDSGRGMRGQPGSQRPLEPKDDLGEGLHITIANLPDGGLNGGVGRLRLRVGQGSHRSIMAPGQDKFP